MVLFRKYYFLILLLAFGGNAIAQEANTGAKPVNNINQVDAKGKRDGMWYIYQPERMGEDAYSEFGSYDHGIKMGVWYKANNEGDLVAIEGFKNNVLNGEVKYFEKGRLYCIGHYRGLNPAHEFDTVAVIDPVTGVETLRSIPSERGALRHGIWRFYDPVTGRLQREEEYQVDELIFRKEFLLTKEDSLYYKEREKLLPHNQSKQYKPSANRQHSYTDYKGY